MELILLIYYFEIKLDDVLSFFFMMIKKMNIKYKLNDMQMLNIKYKLSDNM